MKFLLFTFFLLQNFFQIFNKTPPHHSYFSNHEGKSYRPLNQILLSIKLYKNFHPRYLTSKRVKIRIHGKHQHLRIHYQSKAKRKRKGGINHGRRLMLIITAEAFMNIYEDSANQYLLLIQETTSIDPFIWISKFQVRSKGKVVENLEKKVRMEKGEDATWTVLEDDTVKTEAVKLMQFYYVISHYQIEPKPFYQIRDKDAEEKEKKRKWLLDYSQENLASLRFFMVQTHFVGYVGGVVVIFTTAGHNWRRPIVIGILQLVLGCLIPFVFTMMAALKDRMIYLNDKIPRLMITRFYSQFLDDYVILYFLLTIIVYMVYCKFLL